MPHMFGDAVEEFIDTVLARWDELYVIQEYSALCNKLYELYHEETAQVVATKTEQVFVTCMNNMVEMHKRVGGTVRTKQGYHEFHSALSLVQVGSAQDLPYRVYVNASTKNVIVLGRILIAKVCLTGEALYFKIATTAAAVDARKDAIVIYLFGRDRAERIARDLGKITGESLTPTVPGLSKAVAPGISIAVDPSSINDEVSFGQSRVRPFATAILCYRDKFATKGLLDGLSGEQMYEVFARLLTGSFRAHGINPLDPSATGNTISRAQDCSASAVVVPHMDVMAATLYVRRVKRAPVMMA